MRTKLTEELASQDQSFALNAFVILGLLQIFVGSLFLLVSPVVVVFCFQYALGTIGGPGAILSIDASRPMYCLLGWIVVTTWLIVLGMGSVNHKTWARNLMLLLVCIMLICGLTELSSFTQTMTRQDVGGFVLQIQLVLLPALLVAIYAHPNVRAACESRPAPYNWTDRCPFTVLLQSTLLGIWFLPYPAAPFSSGSTEWIVKSLGSIRGYGLLVLLSGAGIAIAHGTYRLRHPAWRSGLAYWVILLLISVAPICLNGTQGHYAEDLARQGVWLVVLFGLLLYNLRYFRKNLAHYDQVDP